MHNDETKIVKNIRQREKYDVSTYLINIVRYSFVVVHETKTCNLLQNNS